MPRPAMVLHGAVHLHDNLAGHVHVHSGDNAMGHVHGSTDPDDDHLDDIAKVPFCSLACMAAFIPSPPWTVPLILASTVEFGPGSVLEGVEPDGLSRPPSIPSIA
jgi:hypothetical protein